MNNPQRPARKKFPGKKGRDPEAEGAEFAPPLGDAARHAVFLTLARQCRKWPELDLHALEGAVSAVLAEGTDRDRAFAHAIHHITVSRWLTLRFLIGLYCQRPASEVEPRIMGALMGGAAQIVFMDRVPVHAAINHAVEWAKSVAHPGAAGMVNAVLRRIAGLVLHADSGGSLAGTIHIRPTYTDLRDELPLGGGDQPLRALVLAAPVLPENAAERLGVATSHPTELLALWSRSQSFRDVRARCLHTLMDPPVIFNSAFATGPLPPSLVGHSLPGHTVFTGSHAELVQILQDRQDIWVQDPASAKAVLSVQHLRPNLILDLCAGQGTKTRQLAATFPNSRIVATDIDEPRFGILQRQFEGSSQVQVLPNAKLREEMAGKADLILLDVPCSNTGVLPRRPEARYRFSRKATESLVNAQRQILADSIPLLNTNPRGQILYSTCSLEAEENALQGQWIVKWHGFRLSHESSTLPNGLPGSSPTEYSDGSYSVLISS